MASFSTTTFSGPSIIVADELAGVSKFDHFPGVIGVIELRMGTAGRTIRQTTYCLQTGVGALAALIAEIQAIEAFVNAGIYTLTDDFSETHTNCSMQSVRRGRIETDGTDYLCALEIVYRQLV